MSHLEIIFGIDGFGDEVDLEKRHALEDFLDHILRSENLGYVNGGSIGNGEMEVGCTVLDFEKAKKLIVKKLKDSEFSDYLGILERRS